MAGHVHSEFGLYVKNHAIISIEMDTLAVMTGGEVREQRWNRETRLEGDRGG